MYKKITVQVGTLVLSGFVFFILAGLMNLNVDWAIGLVSFWFLLGFYHLILQKTFLKGKKIFLLIITIPFLSYTWLLINNISISSIAMWNLVYVQLSLIAYIFLVYFIGKKYSNNRD
ncbi:MAG: hypothetical protein OT477_02545 [Chloroflexi bacterium]|nr:hypothetical protein [Chloroflexota bacterium]